MDPELRLFVQERAELLTFHVEHVQARQHLDDDSPDNLALACPDCNRHKGPNLTSIEPFTREVVLLFHPRKDRWSDHFLFDDDAVIVGLTPTGMVTVRLLDMNSAARVNIRKVLIDEGEY